MKSISSFRYEDVEGFRFGYSPIGKPKLLVYIYFVDGLLIDTGQRHMQKDIIKTVKSLPVDQIFITHHHEDHTGNITELQNHFNCPILSSKLCSEIMEAPPKISFAQKMVWGDRPAYKGLEVRENSITTNQFQFEIIPIPGHAPDMVALYEPNKKWLFSADLFINTYIAYFLENESIVDQINSIKTVLKLDFEVMFCAHKPILENSKAKLNKKLNFLLDFYEQVVDLHQKGFLPKQIFKKLQLKEDWFTRILSSGALSKMNMVKSVIRDFEVGKEIG